MSREDVVLKLLGTLLDLRKKEPTKKEDLPEWYEMANKVKDIMGKECDGIDIPHFLWHYLDDADIRLKDPRYAVIQNNQLEELIAKLNDVSKG